MMANSVIHSVRKYRYWILKVMVLVRSWSGWYGRLLVLVCNRSGWYGRYSVDSQSVWLARKLECWYVIGLVGTEVRVLVRNRSGWYGRYSVGT
jgi:hypothetical protein